MTPQQAEQLDAEVAARLDALDRFAAVVAHDLGNIILPNAKLKTDQPSTELRKCHDKLHDLADHIMTTRTALDIWRDHARMRDTPMSVGDWWFTLGRLLAGVFNDDVQVRLDPQTDASITIDAGQVTRLLAHVFVALDLQCDSLHMINVHINTHDGRTRVLLNIEHELAVDDAATSPRIAESLLGAGGSIEQFSASTVEVNIGPRASE